MAPGIGASVPVGGFAGMKVTVEAAVLGVLLALGLAVAVGLPPALRAMRLSIVNALAGH
jgi:putative ABC transport system permease protein